MVHGMGKLSQHPSISTWYKNNSYLWRGFHEGK